MRLQDPFFSPVDLREPGPPWRWRTLWDYSGETSPFRSEDPKSLLEGAELELWFAELFEAWDYHWFIYALLVDLSRRTGGRLLVLPENEIAGADRQLQRLRADRLRARIVPLDVCLNPRGGDADIEVTLLPRDSAIVEARSPWDVQHACWPHGVNDDAMACLWLLANDDFTDDNLRAAAGHGLSALATLGLAAGLLRFELADLRLADRRQPDVLECHTNRPDVRAALNEEVAAANIRVREMIDLAWRDQASALRKLLALAHPTPEMGT